MISVNEHNIDRIVRFVLALVLIVWALFQWPVALAQPWPVLAAVLGVVFIVTAVIGFCPLYSIFRFSTAGKK